jgi:rSAM/selenodomain-associated transferase 2
VVAISVIVPALEEAGLIEAALRGVVAQLRADDELIVVDGASRDDTVARARGTRLSQLRVLTTTRSGRGLQMNLGAAAARSEWLLFLHADTRLPPGGLETIRAARGDWGFFPVRLDADGLALRAVAAGINRRSRAWSTPSGDQAIFVRRQTFLAVGGYPEVPFLEDLLLVDQLRQRGAPTVGSKPVVTSARRWQRRGVLRTVLRMWALRAAFRLGASPERLARHYPRAVR